MNFWRNMSLKSKIALLPALAIFVLVFIEVNSGSIEFLDELKPYLNFPNEEVRH